MTKNYGIIGGSAVRGYYAGKNMRMDAEDRIRDQEDYEEDRKRSKRLQGQYDPIDLETAMLRLQDAKRTGELSEYIHGKGYGKTGADEKAGTSTLNYASAQRRGNVEKMGQPGAEQRVRYTDQAATQANALANQQHPINMQQADFTGQQLGDQMGDYDQGRDFWKKYENVQNMLGSFSMTGNPKIIMDAYDMYMDDGFDAVITKLPPLKEGDGPRYKVVTNNPEAGPVIFDNKEHLLKETEKIFMDYLQKLQPMGQGQSAYGINMDAFGNSTQDYGKPPADVKTAEYLLEAMRGIEKYKDLSPEEMRIAAFEMANMKVDDSPESKIREFFVKTFMQELKGPAGGLGPTPDPAEAWETATEMTDLFRYYQFGIGQKPKIKTSGGDKSGVEDWVNSRIHP